MLRKILVKIFFTYVISATIFSIAFYFFAKPILLPIINKELQKSFKESSVSGFRLTKNFIEFQNIEIKRGALCYFKIKEARLYYNLNSIVNKKIEKVLLNEISAKVDIGRDGLPWLYPFPVVAQKGGSKFSITKFEVTNINLDLTKDDIEIKGNASLQLDILTGFIDYLKLNNFSLKTNKIEIEGISLSAAQNQEAGKFYIKAVNYSKLKIGDVIGKSELKGNVLNISPILVDFLGGSVKGEFNVMLNLDMNYNLRLSSQGMEIKRFVNDMKFNEKLDMTGMLDGEFYLSGKTGEIKDIKGNFHTDNSGGVLVIKDKTFLKNIAKQANQPLDIIVESFRNYNYNNGMISLAIENNNLIMDMKLNGKAGKRNLTAVLHDFKKEKEKR